MDSYSQKGKKTTISDIAREAGVSTAAVSRALNDHSDISEEMKAKIKRIAKEMHYAPNLAARAVRTKRTYNVGTIYRYDDFMPHSFFSKILSYFCYRLQKEGYDLTYISPKAGKRAESYLSHCLMKGFEGLLLACVDFTDPRIIEVANGEIPFVSIDHRFENGICVTSDNGAGMNTLLEYCYANGHRKICFIHGQDGYVTRIRKNAFSDFVAAKGMASDSFLIESEYYNANRTLDAFKSLLNREDKPTCILFPDDYSAVLAMQYARLNHISIPDDVSIAGYDSAEVSSLVVPSLTTVEQDTKTIGRLAAENLLHLMAKEISSVEIRVPVKLIIGETIKNIHP
ncbi:MAG: LacI family transcriptional regulator [Clostridiales bacterium]|jgi:DNA-binding LacI/PurR family transcriptional regulator|nr:LacI family transcriptional regulator [Clostridiales bacterium]